MRNNFAQRGSYLPVILFAVLFTCILTLSMPEIVRAQATTNPGNPTTTSALTTSTVPITTTSISTTTTSATQPTTTTTSVPTTTTSQPTTTTSVPITTTVPVTTTVSTKTTTIPSEEIPTLGEWGIIIFMTIILGIGIVAILKRRTEEK